MRPQIILVAVAAAAAGAVGIKFLGAPAAAPARAVVTAHHEAPRDDGPRVAQTPERPLAVVHGDEAETSLGLLSLERSGPKVVTAKVRYTNDGFETTKPALDDPEVLFPTTARGLRLIDEVNGREHFPLESADGACLCSSEILWVKPGKSIDVYAKFPAPPPGVTRVSLHVPEFPSFDDVRIDP